ncbi:MAG: hypothetical protein ACYDBJ_27350 [Aggregatilineales bacterium]
MSVKKAGNQQHENQENGALADGIDKLAVYRTLVRILVHLEGKDYTGEPVRQAEVLEHDDPPNPASESSISQG